MSAPLAISKWVWVTKLIGHVRLQQLVALVSLLLVYGLSLAAENVTAPSGRVPKPTLEQGKGDKCVEDTEFMRKNHMKLLLHQRDETVHKGIRTKKYSLQNCIECHASQKTNSVIGSDQNFCQSCHSYASVKLDCFECHATKPKAAGAFHPIVPQGARTEGNQPPLIYTKRTQMRAAIAQQDAAKVNK